MRFARSPAILIEADPGRRRKPRPNGWWSQALLRVSEFPSLGFTSTVNSGTRWAQLGARLAGVATARTSRIAGQLLLLVGLAFVLLRLHAVWHDAKIRLGAIDWRPFLASGVIAILAVVATAGIWLLVVQRLGARPRPGWVGIFLEAPLAKYIPGSVWHYAGRAALAGEEGLPLRVTTVSVSIELGASVTAAGVVGGLTLGIWGLVCTTAIAGVLLAVASRVPAPSALRKCTADDALMVAVAFRGLLTIVDVGVPAAGAIVLRLGSPVRGAEPTPVLGRGTVD